MILLALLLALFVPRLLILYLWFMTAWFAGIYDTLLWPVLGFIFLPVTFLWFSAVQKWYGGEWTTVPVAGLVLALLIDLSSSGASGRRAT
jgi:hypothetical protein